MIEGLASGTLVAGRGYDSDALRGQLQEAGVFLCVPTRKGRKEPQPFRRGYGIKSHSVENNFCRLKRHRRLATRYDMLANSYKLWVVLGSISLWLN